MIISNLLRLKNNRKKGFSLVELIISVGTLSVAGAFILLFFAYSKDINTRSFDLDNSVYYSNYIIESIKAEIWDDEPTDNSLKIESLSQPDGTVKKIYFNKDWEIIETQEDAEYIMEFYLDNKDEIAMGKGLYDLRITVTKKNPYFRSMTVNRTLYTVETKVFISTEEGDSLD